MTVEEFEAKVKVIVCRALRLIEKNKGVHIEVLNYILDPTYFYMKVILQFPKNKTATVHIRKNDITDTFSARYLPLLGMVMPQKDWDELANKLSLDDFVTLCIAGWLYAYGLGYNCY